MKKLLIIAALLPAVLFGQQAKNVQVAPGETFDENNIVVSAGGARLKSIPIVWTSGNSTLSLTGNITLTGNVIANGIGGATANGQVLLGNATSGDFQIGNISAGSGISLTPGPGTLQVSANQSLFQSVKVSGQNDIIATSPTANVTFSGTGGVVITTNNTTNTVTVDGSGISGGSLFTGFTTAIPTAESVPSGWSLTGVNGIPEYTTPDADYKVIFKTAGDVAAVTANVSAGEVLTGTQVLFETSTPSAAIRYTTNGTDPTRTSGTVVSGPVTITTDTTYEVIGYRDYWVDTAVGSFAYTIDPVPTLASAEINGTALTLTYSEAVSRGAGYANAHFDLDMSTTGSNIAVTYVSGDGTTTHTYTAASAAVSGETVDLDFSGAANSIEETAGYNQDLAAITSAAVTNATAGGGGWNYVEESTFNGADSGLNPSTIVWSDITLPTGDATQIGIHISTVNFPGTIRLALYSNAGSKLAEAVTSTISTTGWHNVTISTIGVTSGTYKVGYIGQDNDALDVSQNTSTGTLYYEAGQSGGNAPSTLPTPLGSATGNIGMRVWVE